MTHSALGAAVGLPTGRGLEGAGDGAGDDGDEDGDEDGASDGAGCGGGADGVRDGGDDGVGAAHVPLMWPGRPELSVDAGHVDGSVRPAAAACCAVQVTQRCCHWLSSSVSNSV